MFCFQIFVYCCLSCFLVILHANRANLLVYFERLLQTRCNFCTLSVADNDNLNLFVHFNLKLLAIGRFSFKVKSQRSFNFFFVFVSCG